MNPGLAATIALLAVAFIVFAIVLSRPLRRQRDVALVIQPDGSYLIRTPLGRAVAQLVVHDEMGRVYEIRFLFRRERGIAYSPPTPVLLRKRIERLVTERTGESS